MKFYKKAGLDTTIVVILVLLFFAVAYLILTWDTGNVVTYWVDKILGAI